MKVLFLTQTGRIGASARYRVYQYLGFLKKEGIEFLVVPAVSDKLLRKYHDSGGPLIKLQFYSSHILRRLLDLQKAKEFDVIFIQRDLIIHIYPFLEKLTALCNRNIIFDFDDAIYLYPSYKKTGFLFRLLWDRKKVERIAGISRHIIVSNNHLRRYIEKFSKNDVTVIPTSVDLGLYGFRKKASQISDNKVTIGWIGSQGTFIYLEKIFPVFQDLAKKYNIELNVIGARGRHHIEGVKINYIGWNLDNEIEDMNSFDIGIMPLTDDEWSRGKSATKLLQYMAIGIPAVASAVGINKEIIEEGVNGFLASDINEWINKISLLIENRKLGGEIVKQARIDVEKKYSVQANAPCFCRVIKEAAG